MTGYQAYQGNQVEGAGPLGLVILTYDALNKSLGRARLGIEAKDFAEEATHTGRALEALIELSSSLNMEQGGDVAKNLASLYTYMMNHLTEGMCSGSTASVDEVMELAATLRDGWKALEKQESRARAASRPVARMSASPAMAAYAR